MKRIATLLLAIAWLGLAARPRPAAATPPSPPPCKETAFPSAYIGPLVSTETWDIFADWRVKEVRLPYCQARDIPYEIAIEFLLPADYSSRGVVYRLTVIFSFDEHAALTNASAIRDALLNPAEKIRAFERDPVVKQYLALASDPVVRTHADANNSSVAHPERIQLWIDGYNSLVYDLAEQRAVGLNFTNPALIAIKEQLVPLIGTSPLAEEFQSRVGINYVVFSSETLTMAPNMSEDSVLTLDSRSGALEYFSLPSRPPWTGIPRLAAAHAAIDAYGYDRQNPSCAIGRGAGHTSKGAPEEGSIGRVWRIEVILECTDGAQPIGWKQVRVRVGPKGIIGEPEVTDESISQFSGEARPPGQPDRQPAGRPAGWARRPAAIGLGVLAALVFVAVAARQIRRKNRQP